MRRSMLGFSIAILAVLAAPAGARLSLPDGVVYGVVSQGGVTVPADSTVCFVPAASGVRCSDPDRVLARARVGARSSSPDLYVARIALDQTDASTDPRPEGRARVGDRLEARLQGGGPGGDDLVLGQVVISGQGVAIRRNFAIAASGTGEPTPEDLDGDSIPNALDNCARTANATQADADGDGIGDACQGDARSNPARRAREVGDVGNASDADTGFGRVNYVYWAGEREVTNAQYAAFLRAVAREDDPEALFNSAMATSPAGGIVLAGIPGELDYVVKPSMGAKPVNFVSWLDAARYANWIENGSPEGEIGPDTTETGAFDLTGADPSITAVIEEEAESSLPSEDEWYKAAYYDPQATADAGFAYYWTYPAGSNAPPTAATADAVGDVANAGANVANYEGAAGWNGANGNVVTTGDAGAASPSGILDAGGNVAEWLGAPSEDGKRIVRGGSFQSSHTELWKYAGVGTRADVWRDPGYEGADIGMRLVPEPDAAGSALVAALVLRLLAWAAARAGARR